MKNQPNQRRVLLDPAGSMLSALIRRLALSLLAFASLGSAQEARSEPLQPAPLSATDSSRLERQRISARNWRSDLSVPAETAALSDDPQVIAAGARIYLEGLRDKGQPLVGLRLDGQVRVAGAAAACVLCHRRSGLGAVEGVNQIAPITGRYLFDQDRRAVVNMNLRARKSFNQRHEPYSLTTLAKALRDGLHESGRQLDPLMPHYQLSDAEVLAVASYLRRLSNSWSAGVSEKRLQLATVVTPDVDPESRRIFLATVNAIVAQKNGNILHSAGQRTMSSGAEMVLQTDRSWDMQVWQLQGQPSSWGAQLLRLQAEHPVFALASGLGAGNWEPVQRFCEQQALPCWFPSVAAVPAQSSFYSVYFSRGAALEAEVLATSLTAGGKRGKLLQVYADAGVADSAVTAMRARMAEASINSSEFRLNGDAAGVAGLAARLAALNAEDSVVFWLTPSQLQALDQLAPSQASSYFSASLGGGDQLALNPAWRKAAHLLYPYQLPELRQRGLAVFKEWLRIRQLPLENELLQSEVYFALNYLNDTLVDMLDNLHRDYLLERGESMLSLREAARAEDEARGLGLPRMTQVQPGSKPLRPMTPRALPHAVLLGSNSPPPQVSGAPMLQAESDDVSPNARNSGAPQSTSAYPRLSLAQFQRHASKGAYIVRIDNDQQLHAESDWIIP